MVSFKDKMTPIAASQAAVPELYSSMPSNPQINLLYLAPGQDLISPEQFKAFNPETLAHGAGTILAKMSPSTLRTSVPVPKLFAAYAYGPLDRDVDDFGSEDLAKSWGKCTPAEKQMISTDLKTHMTELRSLTAAGYIGSVHDGPVTDVILEWSTNCRGPFKSEEGFNATISDTFVAKSKGQVGPYIRGMLDAHKHGIVFTHGDLRPDNILVKNGRVTAIVVWEMAGWYPDYWEFVKAFWLETFADDWASCLLGVLTPCYCEQLIYAKLMSVLW
ncbi:hypothetical protein K402DRAFT_448038 [Aulographum hederae CBS 113979]|uniref:Aminoglycoside phosphotransferase domain-containing protein n=1 Tax=Aulographum hederae CBS 113979 TaxID=1176131 RepID=A0A6G1GSA2_9PEZI|nr:hypothetical protein K402DRAFT_448038 [Aulographum hederae CBS 113979]